ncbi:hypothetical protein [Cellulomonas cellasea]|uniref:DUF998 domain-containing protein n=1 Tax=Cellulomonas cellasea TaxID=43670 RepID=A0A7W4YBA5_9CELL|nr:hypothetical protein [Cellulomonas cellasea]MBB2923695.1 hypothetical protein [Cellulomonas cellasea]
MATERETYRYLRLATIVLLVMLAAAVVGQAVAAGCWQTSISAYYWTAAHGIVVGSLCALGACLVVYRGSSDTEDVVLGISGYLAFVVAMVPVRPEPLCGGPGLPVWDVSASVRNDVGAVLVAAALTELLTYLIGRRAHPRRELDGPGRFWRWVKWAVLVAVAAAYVLAPEQLERHGHYGAALLMFAGIVVVVVANAFSSRREEPSSRFSTAYWVVAASMVLTLVVELVLRQGERGAERGVIVVEALLVLEFAAFWAVQTVELWGYPTRTERVRSRRAEALAPGTPAADRAGHLTPAPHGG